MKKRGEGNGEQGEWTPEFVYGICIPGQLGWMVELGQWLAKIYPPQTLSSSFVDCLSQAGKHAYVARILRFIKEKNKGQISWFTTDYNKV